MADKYFMSPPLGVIRLAGYLSAKGHQAEHFDPNLSIVTGIGVDLETKLREKPWDFIGFSVLDETLPTDIRNMYLSNKICPKAILLAGGIEAQFNYQTILDKTPCNIVIIGEGELPVSRIVNGDPLHEIPGVVFKNKAKPLSQELFNDATLSIPWEDLPYEDYWDHYIAKYGDKMTKINEQEIHTVRVFSRNRCPIGCKFCSSTNQLTWGSDGTVPVLSMTEDNLIDVVERIIKAHPRTKTIYLTDDDFVINKRSVMRFCEKVIERDFGDLTFMCFARASDLNKEVLDLMSRANFRRLIIGVESFSQPVLDDMNKRCDEQEIHDALALCNDVGIKPHINVILISPTVTLDDIEVSIDNALYYLYRDMVYCGVISAIRPLKGTEYFESYVDYQSQVVEVPGTPFKLKVDDMIWADDPLVRLCQEAYWNGIDNEVGRLVESAGIVHPTGNNVAEFSLMFMKKLIHDVRAKNGLQNRIVPLQDESYRKILDEKFEEYLDWRSKIVAIYPKEDDGVVNKLQRSVVYK